MTPLNILITGSTDGIGKEAVKKFLSLGHNVLVHGRNQLKLETMAKEYGVDTFQADFSSLKEVRKLAEEVQKRYDKIDILINNAGVFKTPNKRTEEGYDIRFMVNTFAPYLLTKLLLPIIPKQGRILNLSSAAQTQVDFEAMLGKGDLEDLEAYAQSKLAITMWSRQMTYERQDGPVILAVNPGSLLGTKMVKEGFNTAGNDINIGVDILEELALAPQYAKSTGKYFDNDNRRFADPADDGLDEDKTTALIENLERVISI